MRRTAQGQQGALADLFALERFARQAGQLQASASASAGNKQKKKAGGPGSASASTASGGQAASGASSSAMSGWGDASTEAGREEVGMKS